MLKKSLLSLAVTASLVGLAGCDISSTTANSGAKPDLQKQQEEFLANYGTFPIFDPVNSRLPLGIDLIFAAAPSTDGTASVGATAGNPVLEALNDIDGISTIAPIDIPVSGSIDPDSIVKGTNVILVKVPSKADVQANFIFPDVVGTDGTGYNIAGDDEDFEALSPLNYEALDLTHFGALLAAENFAGDAATVTTKLGTNVTFLQALQASSVAGDYEVSVLGLDGGTNNTIRVSPTKPLDPKSKYIVIITNGVENTAGASLKPSPDYAVIKAGDASKFASSALVNVSKAVNGWEGIAAAASGANPAAVGFDPASVVISAAFTTTDPTAVLKSMAYPGYWAESDVALNNATVAEGLITLAKSKGLTTDPEVAGLKGAANALGVTDAGDQSIFAAGYLINTALTTDLGDGIAYESPRNRDYEAITGLVLNADPLIVKNQVPLFALNSDTAALGGNKVLVSQGAIELPQYTTTLTDVNQVASWEANAVVGGVLDGLNGNDAGTTPPKDNDGSTNVTYRFPFAQEQRKTVAPLMFIEPVDATKATDASYDALVAGKAAEDSVAGITGLEQAGACARNGDNKWPVIISQHGFTVHRAGTLLMGAQLAQNTCSVVVAMDLPHHGIAPLSSDRNGNDITNSVLGLTIERNDTTLAAGVAPFAAAVETLVTADANSLLADLAERHENLYLSGSTPVPMTWGDTKAGKSGDLYIQLTNFQRTRDNNRQAVMDLLNLNATLATIDIDGDDTPDLDVDNVSYVGHSLGAIVGTSFVAVNNDETVQIAANIPVVASGGSAKPTLPLIQSAVLATPGGGLTKLLENSGSYGPPILGGLSAAAGIQQGDSAFESFMTTFQATVDSGDPMNFVSDLKSGESSATNTMIIEMIGGGAISSADSDTETTKLPDSLIALGVYPADTVIPNSTTAATQETARLPLAGTDPMIELLGSTEVDTAGANQVQSYPVTKFNQGTHGTFSSADSVAVFTEMVTETATFVGSAGAAISVANDDVLGEAP